MSRVRTPRVRAGIASAAVLATLGALPLAVAASASRGDYYTSNCPKPENLVTGTTWHTRKLASGITLKEGQHGDPNGVVKMHLLTVDLANRHVHLAPLMHHLSIRQPLSQLAGHQSKLVAATNTGYFDFRYSAPLGPVIYPNAPIVASASKQEVVGFNAGKVSSGKVWLAGTVTAGGTSRALVGFNTLVPATGITAYTPRWGNGEVVMPRDAIGRYVDKGVISSAPGRTGQAHSSGYLLVARGQSAAAWLVALKRGDAVKVTHAVKTDARAPFREAYSVGNELVLPGGKIRTDMRCRRGYPQPARLAVGWANGGKTLLLLQVEDKPGTYIHGLDENQMSRLFANLGAKEAWAFDGSGSAEVLARMPGTHKLSMRNYPADGQERPMPVGLGIFTS